MHVPYLVKRFWQMPVSLLLTEIIKQHLSWGVLQGALTWKAPPVCVLRRLARRHKILGALQGAPIFFLCLGAFWPACFLKLLYFLRTLIIFF